MKKLVTLLVSLMSSLAITGISFFDDAIWHVVFMVVGMVAYFIVGVLFSAGVLHGSKAGREAYYLMVLLLIACGYGVYKLLELLNQWILSWPLAVKISVVSVLFLLVVFVVVLIILKKRKDKNGKRLLRQSGGSNEN